MNNRHAYLIMAHNDFYILEKLICLLDHDRNDIYIHIDKKVKEFDFDYYKNLVNKSRLFYTEKRVDVRWGDYSQIECELTMLECAVKNGAQYYHLISGVDMPLKKAEEMHKFYDNSSFANTKPWHWQMSKNLPPSLRSPALPVFLYIRTHLL